MQPIEFLHARDLVLDNVHGMLPSENVPYVLCAGRVLATEIVASENIPAADNSAMDGFAVRAEDTVPVDDAHASLPIVGEASAGAPFTGTLGHGQAVRIMTGAIVPDGANAVIEVESTDINGEVVTCLRSISAGNAIRRVGEDIRAGDVIIEAGKRLTPGDVGVLASLGVVSVPVVVKPKVGILSTGNEIVEPSKTPAPGQLRNSSAAALYALCAEAGAEPVSLGIVGDDKEELADRLEQGLRYDILLTTGGVSMGDYDYVQQILPELGVRQIFHNVNIKPGKPLWFGVYSDAGHDTLVFGLPGNPVSSLVTFHQFVRPAIFRLLRTRFAPLRISAIATDRLKKEDTKRHFLRGIVSTDTDGSTHVSTTGTQSSSAMRSMSLANCLIVLDEERQTVEPGEPVMVEMIDYP